MKKLKDFEKEINQCSKCGLCQAACPIFKITGNECAVSKGKFTMLSGVIKGDLTLNKKINSYLDLCTKCGKCSDYCPAGINVCEILQTAKYEYLEDKSIFKLTKFLQSSIIFDNIIKIFRTISNLFRANTHHLIPSANAKKILYFKGCVNEVLPKSENALKKILSKTNIQLVETDLKCCGLPFFSSGNLERFEEIKDFNTEKLNTIDTETILTDCASCEHTLKNYKTLNKKIINVEDLFVTQNFVFEFQKPQKVTFHEPCHAQNNGKIEVLLKNCKNIEFIKIPQTCCGLAGDFTLKNPKISKEIAKLRANEIIQSGATTVITTCPACVLGLKKALWGKNIKVLLLTEFLARAEKISFATNP